MKDVIVRHRSRCKGHIRFKKDKLIDCKCGTKVPPYRMNNNLLVESVTPYKKQVSHCESN